MYIICIIKDFFMIFEVEWYDYSEERRHVVILYAKSSEHAKKLATKEIEEMYGDKLNNIGDIESSNQITADPIIATYDLD